MGQAAQSINEFLEGSVESGGLEKSLAALIHDLVEPVCAIAREVDRGGLIGILGLADSTNVHGEDVKQLDLISNDIMVDALREGGNVCGMASEEVEELIPAGPNGDNSEFVICFDPLDGSSNIDVNVSIGTIFSVFRRTSASGPATMEDFLRPGREQVAAGYALYGTSTMLVFTTGNGVNGFTLDPEDGNFYCTNPDMKTAARGKIYSANEGNSAAFDEGTQAYLASLKDADGGEGRPYSARYVGSLVADFHRNLLKGGIFLYPAVRKAPSEPRRGKLRLLYEANPMAMVCEQAGGASSDGTGAITDIVPEDVHQKVPLIVGSREDVAEYESFVAKAAAGEVS